MVATPPTAIHHIVSPRPVGIGSARLIANPAATAAPTGADRAVPRTVRLRPGRGRHRWDVGESIFGRLRLPCRRPLDRSQSWLCAEESVGPIPGYHAVRSFDNLAWSNLPAPGGISASCAVGSRSAGSVVVGEV